MTSPAQIIGPAQERAADKVPLLPAPAAAPSLEQVREFIRASKAENTLRGYTADWRDFCGWCEPQGHCPLPAVPETVAAYIADCAGRLNVGSLQRRLNAIAEAHKAAGLASPTGSPVVRNTMKGIRRTMGTALAQKTAALTDDVRSMVDAADAGDYRAEGPGAYPARVCRRFPAIRTRGPRHGGLHVQPRWSHSDATALQDRSGGSRTQGWHSIRRKPGDMPGPHPAGMDGTGGHHQRAAIPFHQSSWPVAAGEPLRYRRGTHHKEAGFACGPPSCQVCRAFASGWPRHKRGDCGRFRAVDHEPDGCASRKSRSRWSGAFSCTHSGLLTRIR